MRSVPGASSVARGREIRRRSAPSTAGRIRLALPLVALTGLLLFASSASAGQTHLFQFAINGTALPPKATGKADLHAATGTATVSKNSNTLTEVNTSSGAFAVGMTVFGPGIPASTVIVQILSATEFNISNPAKATAVGAGIEAGSITNLTTATGAFGLGQTLVGSGLPPGTRIDYPYSNGSINVLSKPVTTAGTAVPLSGYILKPESIAVDSSSGDLYVADDNLVERLGPGGEFLSRIDGSETVQGSFGALRALSVDQSDGDLYVVDSGNAQVDKFDSAGTLVKSFAQEGQLSSVPEVPGSLSFAPSAVAVDPATGDLYVADFANRVIDVFDSTGKFIREFETGRRTTSLAIDSQGNLFANGSGGGTTTTGGVSVYVAATGQLNLAYGGGTGQLDSGEGGVSTAVGVDPANDHVFVTDSAFSNREGGVDFGRVPAHIAEYDEAGHLLSTSGAKEFVGSNPSGLAVGDGAGHIYVARSEPNDDVVVFDRASVPVASPTIAEATNLAPTSATLNGAVFPEGVEVTECIFEYGPTEQYGHTAPCKTESGQPIGTGSVPVQVHADVTGLTAATVYHFRLAAADENGAEHSSDQIFGEPPHVDATSVSLITSSAAELEARIDPGDVAATYHFEYSTDPGFAGATSVPVPDGSIPSARSDQAVSQPISGLTPETTYYYRAVAVNSAAPVGVVGPTKALVTHSTFLDTALPDNRAYELVSPSLKEGGGGVYAYNYASREMVLNSFAFPPIFQTTTAGGLAITYPGENFFEPPNLTGGEIDQYTSFRGPAGWTTRNTSNQEPEEAFAPLAPPALPPAPVLPAVASSTGKFVEETPDGSIVFFTDVEKLTPDSTAAKGEPDLYRYAVETEALTDLTVAANPAEPADVQGVLGVGGEAAEAGSYVYFIADGALTGSAANPRGAAAQPGQPNLYLSHGGATRFIATLSPLDEKATESGGVLLEGVTTSTESFKRVRDWAPLDYRTAEPSPNGRYLAFGAVEELTGQPAAGPQVFRYDAASDSLLCASCNPDGSNSPAAIFLGSGASGGLRQNYMSNNGRFFFNDSGPLVSQDVNGRIDVYEFEDAGTGTCLTSGGCRSLISGGGGTGDSLLAAVSGEGNDVFFTSTQQLTSEDRDGSLDLYDARIDGRTPPLPLPPCETGEACHGPTPPPPVFQSPASAGFHGPGNPLEKPCKKGLVRKGAKCVKKPSKHHGHKKHHKRAASHKRGGHK
jgi:sugar lactone lactonase YvrE